STQPSISLLPAPPPDRSLQPFFLCSVQPRGPAESTNPFVQGNQVLGELLEAVKLGQLLLRFCAVRRNWESSSVTVLPATRRVEAKLRIMSSVAVFGAVTGRRLPQRRVMAVMEPWRRLPKPRNSSRSLGL